MSATTVINSLSDMSDDELAAETRRAQFIVNSRNPHPGPTREEGHRRLARIRAGIAERVAEAETAVIHEVSRAPDATPVDFLTRVVALRSLAADEPTWDALAARIDGEPDAHHAAPWSYATDAEAAAAKAERATAVAAARTRLDALTQEARKRERDRAIAAEEEAVARYRARNGGGAR